MARCSYHPDVETEMTCQECGKPICPKEMVLTPVGYKCPEDARPKRSQYTFVKPKQLATAVGVGLVAGVGGGLLLGAVSWGGLLLGVLWGMAVSEAVRRASGGHRGAAVGVVASASIFVGWLAGSFTGGFSLLTAIIAIAVALIQLAVIEFR
ncbi:MAG TPA: hypothetical protein VFG89_02765 [Coriobacteriia bacterium]|nr:hypothetical protein [Coriobacteriia bacterium]